MKFNETQKQIDARLAREAKAAAAATKGESVPRGPSKVIKTLAEAAKVMPSDESPRTVPFINKDTLEWSLSAALTKRFENSIEFSKADASKILGALSDVLQETAEIAFTSKTGVDLSFFNSKAIKFRYNPEKQAPDAILLQAISVAKQAARSRGVAESVIDEDAEVAESLAAYRASSVPVAANLTVKYSQIMVDVAGALIKKV